MIRTTLLSLGLIGMDAANAQSAMFLRDMREDVERLELSSNTARGEALQGILSRLGLRFTLETFEVTGPPASRQPVGTNIVVTLGEGQLDIVVGAHYDAVWLRNGELGRGAVDNAASVVILTRLADELADEMLNKRIRVVFFDQEEIGLVGSRAYLEAHADDNIDAMVNLDVNGYGDTVFFGPVVDQEGGFMQTSMESACRAVRVDCVAFGRVPASDHQSFEREFIPMLQISLLPKVEVEALNAMLNPASAGPRGIRGVPAILALIHTAEDTSERIDPAGMALTFNATLELVRTLDR